MWKIEIKIKIKISRAKCRSNMWKIEIKKYAVPNAGGKYGKKKKK